ncbi:MAG: hypothetical protein ABH868_06625 [bacterium]
MSSNFYNKVFIACKPFLGEHTESFLKRQIEWHLSKNPNTLAPSDKEDLAQWIMISAALIIGKDKAKELYDKVMNL